MLRSTATWLTQIYLPQSSPPCACMAIPLSPFAPSPGPRCSPTPYCTAGTTLAVDWLSLLFAAVELTAAVDLA
ncbi:unnamed protein product [Closterium sp. NIES-53]